MKYSISNEISKMYKTTGKNINYMLDYLLSSLDSRNCKKCFDLVGKLPLNDSNIEVEINDDNIKYIKSLFGKINNELVEKLLWVALLLQEV